MREPERAEETAGLALESLKLVQNGGLAPHTLFTASKDLYRHCEQIARRESILLTTFGRVTRGDGDVPRSIGGAL